MARRKATRKTGKKTGSNMVRERQTGSPQHAWVDAGLNMALRLRRFAWDVGGVFSLALAAMTLLALIGLTSGAWLTPWASILRSWLGWGSLLLVVGLGAGGLTMINRRWAEMLPRLWGRVIALELAAFAMLALLSIWGGSSIERAEAGEDGGLVGWGIAEFVYILLSALPEGVALGLQVVIFVGALVMGCVVGLGWSRPIVAWLERTLEGPQTAEVETIDEPAVSVAPTENQMAPQPTRREAKRKRAYIPPEHRTSFEVEPRKEAVGELPPRDDRLPPLELLTPERVVQANRRHINQTAGLIQKTLAEFGISAMVADYRVGPTVTQFLVKPGYMQKPGQEGDENGGQKVRVSQIAALQRDLALALAAKRLRIQTPVPGQPYVGIEVPNQRSSVVRLRPILETEEFYRLGSPLGIGLGRDVSGNAVVADLARMPHLLIAGTTGSGKSVCIAAITVCLVMNNTPEDLRLVMIDPKMVELVPFNGLPHLYGKVETDLERIAGVLRWVVVEMERRYKLLEALRARDIESYNRKVRRRKEFEPMPRIVVLIDELADLMMSAAEQTETTLVRLAQMARATGIHLVVATQRPSTDVVTGLIKANFPARISFAVASGVDSRVILDGPGAEHLLGRGDMLYLPPEAGTPVRSQGVMITDQEIEKVITHWRGKWTEGEEQSPWDVMMEEEAVLADRDELVERAIQVIRETGRASASHLQRQLRIGYPRAARLVDELEDLAVLGPSRGGGRERDILIELDEDEDAPPA